ncbi:hypothetical protein HMPREF0083_05591 [Aneurinibacillus aneurinilyticus ATCC 12856]|uniref:Uncharacterized protein n=1 Tax=Aneurinibacillus aneurinilyticus ATCC 12856 TaxID=649747 RepID=U1Y3V0_ANEAE|nr:hypothetical protein HMPREF0083_05591 [Aneurinibacillus aneurinilyticus ATCC 12856]
MLIFIQKNLFCADKRGESILSYLSNTCIMANSLYTGRDTVAERNNK